MDIRGSPLRKRLGWGIRIGTFFGGGFALLAMASITFRAVSLDNATARAVALVYLVAGVVGGTVAGFVAPLAKSKIGAVLCASLVASVISGFFGVLLWGTPLRWNSSEWFAIAFAGCGLGVLCGIQVDTSSPRNGNA